jgi:rare lipoprotein A
VRVTNLVNQKSIEVRITDRGPFIDGRVIDLSLAAARAIDIIDSGTAQVRIDPVAGPSFASAAARITAGLRFTVQVGSFHDKANAERLCARLQRTHEFVHIVQAPGDQVLWRVMVGSESTRATAAELAAALSGFVVAEAVELPTIATDVSAQPGND